MAHGLPSGYVRLYDEQGNAVDVSVLPSGKFALSVLDDRVRVVLEDILDEVRKPEGRNPWALKSPWSGKESHEW